jgi:UDP:flavonoid glycosyltransferase YjiC (YdhE family)
MLALPLAGQFEQEMNARYLERLGLGTGAAALDEPALERFLEREPVHEEALAGYEQDGNRDALATVDELVEELGAGRRR